MSQSHPSPRQPRHRAREVALQVLYRFEAAENSGPVPATIAGANRITPIKPTPNPTAQALAISDELTKHFEHFEVPQPLRQFVA